MKLVGSMRYPDPEAMTAGFGTDSALGWWLAAPPGGGGIVRVGRRDKAGLTLIGGIPVSARFDAACICRDGSTLLVLDGDQLHALPLAGPDHGALVESRELPDVAGTAIDSHDGRTVYIARSIHWPPIWRLDRESGAVKTLIPRRGEVTKHQPLLALSPDGRYLAFGHVFDSIELFDLRQGTSALWPRSAAEIPDLQVRTSAMLRSLQFSEDGDRLVAVSEPRRPAPDRPPLLRIGDIAGEAVTERPFPARLPWISVSAGGSIAAAALSDEPHRVELFEPEAGRRLALLDVGHRVLALRLSAAGDRLAVAHAEGINDYAGPVPG